MVPRAIGTGPRVTARWLTSWTVRRALVVLIACAGVGVLLYPMTLDWFHSRDHVSTETAYAHVVESLPRHRITAELRRAHEYNRHLPRIDGADPLSPGQDPTAVPSAVKAYERVLDIGPDGMMGTLQAPSIGLTLPIYHGTDSDTLTRGVGHMFGTAFPVGGPGTHTVLAGHAGVPGNTLFTHLQELKLGDLFTITVLDHVLTYRVDQILTVLPNQVGALAAVPGQDYATLVTCTPIGVNSHRLIVRGVRVPTAHDVHSPGELASEIPAAGFPWWALLGVGGVLCTVLLTSPLTRRRQS